MRLRRTPAERADRRRRVWNAAELDHAVTVKARNGAVGCHDGRLTRSRRQRRQRKKRGREQEFRGGTEGPHRCDLAKLPMNWLRLCRFSPSGLLQSGQNIATEALEHQLRFDRLE